jgi:predicted permease
MEDVRFGLRSFAKNRSFTVLAVVSLALGIGANTTVFSLVNAIFLKPLPVRDVSSLVVVYTRDPKIPGLLPQSYPNFRDYREKNPVFSSMAAYFSLGLSMTGRGEPVPLICQLASGDYFATLGLRPALGRFFGPEEDQAPGAHPVAVLSHGFWRRHFASDPNAVGTKIHINGWPYTVIGVAPDGFHGLNSLILADVWTPSMMYPRLLPNPAWITQRRALLFTSVARLRPGVTAPQAEAALQGLAGELARGFPKDNRGRTVQLLPLAQATISPNQRGNLRGASTVLMSIAGLVLLIACANVANLMLVRGSARAREIAIRVALGAGRWSIVRQLLTESVLLSLAGGLSGVALARWMRDYLWAARPPMLRSLDFQIPIDGRVLTFTFALAVATGILFGLAPALRVSRPDLNAELKDRAGMTPPSGRLNLRSALVVLQVALSLVALVGAGLFLRGLQQAQSTDFGFSPHKLALLQFNLAAQGYDEARGREFYRLASERIAALPGVESVALASGAPFAGGLQRTLQIEGREEEGAAPSRLTLVNAVMPGYLRTMGIPLRRGRDFTDSDNKDGPRVAIVNETLAARYWPGEDAIGRRFRFFGEDAVYEVVGIARTATYLEVGEQPRPNVYTCLPQRYSPLATLHVRLRGDEAAGLEAVRREFRRLEPNLTLEASTMSRVVQNALWAPRLAGGLLGLFGVIGLALTAIGLHGVVAYTVQLRTREIGIRLAIGATPADVVRMIVKDGVRLVALGVIIGSGIALSTTHIIRSLIFTASTTDATTFVGVPAVLVVVGIASCWIPAHRATHIDPLLALRWE